MSAKPYNESDPAVWDYFFDEESTVVPRPRRLSRSRSRRKNEEDKQTTTLIGPLVNGSESANEKRHQSRRSPKKKREHEHSDSLVETLIPAGATATKSKISGRDSRRDSLSGEVEVKKKEKSRRSKKKGRKRREEGGGEEDQMMPFVDTFLMSDEIPERSKTEKRKSRKVASNSDSREAKLDREIRRERRRLRKSKKAGYSQSSPKTADGDQDDLNYRNRGLRRLWCGAGRVSDADLMGDDWKFDAFSTLFFDAEERDQSEAPNARCATKNFERQEPESNSTKQESQSSGPVWPPYDLLFLDPPAASPALNEKRSSKKSRKKREKLTDREKPADAEKLTDQEKLTGREKLTDRGCENTTSTRSQSTTRKEKNEEGQSTDVEKMSTQNSRKDKKEAKRRRKKIQMYDEYGVTNSIREDESNRSSAHAESMHKRHSRSTKIRESAGRDRKPHYSEILMCQ